MPPERSQTDSITRSTVARVSGSDASDSNRTGRPNMKSTIVCTRHAMSFSITTSRRPGSEPSVGDTARLPLIRRGSPASWPWRYQPPADAESVPDAPTSPSGLR